MEAAEALRGIPALTHKGLSALFGTLASLKDDEVRDDALIVDNDVHLRMSAMNFVRALTIVSLLLTADCRSQPGQLERQVEWSAPIDLPGMPANRLHRSPSLATMHDTVYMAANHFPIEGTAMGPRPIYLVRIPGGPFPAPPGDFQFVFPKVVASPSGAVHLLWAEYDTARADALHWDPWGRMAVWHSIFADDAWSQPAEVFRSESLMWPRDTWNVAIDHAGAVHVLLWTFGGNYAGFVHLARTSHAWTVNQTPYRAAAHKFAIDASGDSVRIAFIDPSFGPSDTTGVTIAASPDGGTTWQSSVVHRPGARRVEQLQFVRDRDRLFLSWAEAPPRGFGRDTLRVVRLDELLRTTPLAAISLPRGTSVVTAVATCGNVVYLMETFSLAPQTFEGIITATGQSAQRPLRPPGELAIASGLTATSRSLNAVVAIVQDSEVPGRSVLLSRPSCATAQGR